mmetsp:Transcript_25939/g.39747  ORF Transcript_25939/g.39747 Transcript_25939/m.39747 type:complete len:438 (+) Transcript_25939:184-1497(+)
MGVNDQSSSGDEHSGNFSSRTDKINLKNKTATSHEHKLNSSSSGSTQKSAELSLSQPDHSNDTQHQNAAEQNSGSLRRFLPHPSDILNFAVSNSTRLIGWNDEDFRKLIEEDHKLHPNEIPIEERGFGLMAMLQDIARQSVKDYIKKKNENRIGSDDDDDDLKKVFEQLETKTQISTSNGKSTSAAVNRGREENASSLWGSFNIFSYINMREMKVYKKLLSSLKYQRDSYIMGSDHANQRKNERDDEDVKKKRIRKERSLARRRSILRVKEDESSMLLEASSSSSSSMSSVLSQAMSYEDFLALYPTIPNISTSSMGNDQLHSILKWFIPSPTMHDSLLPTVLWTLAPSPMAPPTMGMLEGGPMRRLMHRSACDLIPMSQPLLDDVMHRNVVWILKDKSWRESVKGSSRNYFMQPGGSSPQQSSDRVITTKTMRVYS